MILKINIFLQVHIVMSHLIEFLGLKGADRGLGFWSEQAMEACHHAFKLEWERNKVFWDHPKYGQKLLQSVVRANSKNI